MSNVVRLRPDVSHIPTRPGTTSVSGIGGDGGATTMFPAALADHLDHLRLLGYTAASIYSRRRAVIRLAAALSREGVGLLEATHADLYGWRAGLTVSADVVCAYVSHARSFYGWCVDQGHCTVNPAADLPTPTPRRRLPRPIGDDALLHAVATAPRRVRPWLVLAGWVGLRAREVAYLRRDHVLDAARPPTLIVAADAGKGRRERVVPLSDYVLTELRLAGLPARGYVFRRRDGQPGPNCPHLISQLANEHLHTVGIGETLHQLRHRFATGVYGATRDLRLTQELLGHAHPSTTAGYADFDRAGAHGAVAALTTPRRLRRVK